VNRKIKEPIKRQVFTLVIVFVVSFFVIYSINSYVYSITEEYDYEILNSRSEYSLARTLSYKLFLIETNFIKIAKADRRKNIEKYSLKIYHSINDFEKIIKILQNGGAYADSIPVNLIKKDQIQEKIQYRKKKKAYVLEVIELSPKIADIKRLTDILIVAVDNKFRQNEIAPRKREEAKINLLMKQVDTYFIRSHESVNKIFYDTATKINEITLKKQKSNDLLLLIKYIIYFLTLLSSGIITIFIFKKIGTLIREREEYLNKIEENNRTIQTIFDAVPVGVMLIDKYKRVQKVNRAALKLFKVSKKEEIVMSSCFDCFNTQLESTCPFDNNIPLKDVEITLMPVKGEQVPVIKNVIPISINSEDFLLEAFMDISEQKEIEEQLIIARNTAEESNRLKSAFLANMSHEIRTPLNGILGFAQILANHEITHQQLEEYSNIIIKSGHHLLSLINDIIDIAKIESGQLKFTKTEVNINQLLQELYSFFQSLLSQNRKSEIKLKLSIPIPDKIIKTDPTRLKQILTNLINNAVKFTEKGFIEFGYKIIQNQIIFHVKDSGIGIPIDKQEIIFERFKQASDTTEKLYGGTGLGLSISKACAEKLGGQIRLISELKKGSEFYISIPLK